jgi:hypothetical protein
MKVTEIERNPFEGTLEIYWGNDYENTHRAVIKDKDFNCSTNSYDYDLISFAEWNEDDFSFVSIEPDQKQMKAIDRAMKSKRVIREIESDDF